MSVNLTPRVYLWHLDGGLPGHYRPFHSNTLSLARAAYCATSVGGTTCPRVPVCNQLDMALASSQPLLPLSTHHLPWRSSPPQIAEVVRQSASYAPSFLTLSFPACRDRVRRRDCSIWRVGQSRRGVQGKLSAFSEDAEVTSDEMDRYIRKPQVYFTKEGDKEVFQVSGALVPGWTPARHGAGFCSTVLSVWRNTPGG
eukprot:scaffold2691_cov417-Prasinococcus_capsulatus_cf.AAC.8